MNVVTERCDGIVEGLLAACGQLSKYRTLWKTRKDFLNKRLSCMSLTLCIMSSIYPSTNPYDQVDLQTNTGSRFKRTLRNHFLMCSFKVELDTLDYEHYLPLFLDGLCETQHPYDFLARKGAEDLITRAPDRVTPLLPSIILPLRSKF